MQYAVFTEFFFQISHFLNEIQTDRLFLSGISFFCIIGYNTLENYLQTLQEIHNAELQRLLIYLYEFPSCVRCQSLSSSNNTSCIDWVLLQAVQK